MRTIVIMCALVTGCVAASATPLSPERPVSESQTNTRNRVAEPSQSAPEKTDAVEPASKAEPVTVTQPNVTAEAGAPTSTPPGSSTVQLLNAGAEPRQLLRYVFHRDQSTRFRLRTESTMDTTISAPGVSTMSGEHSMHQVLPTTECTGTTVTRTVDANGTAHREGWIDGVSVLPTPGVEPTVQSKVEEMLRGFGKTSFRDVIDTRGQVSESHIDLSSISDRMLLETMQQTADSASGLSVVWPLEAVGIGAKWQVQSNFGKRRQLTRNVVVTLSALHGKQVQLDLVTTVTGEPSEQAARNVDVGPGDTRGTAHIDLTLDPMTSRSRSNLRTNTEATTNGVQMRMRLEVATEYRSEI